MDAATPPQPLIDVDSQGFWNALDEGKFAMQRCSECRRFQHPPAERCKGCGATVTYEELAGTGEIFSFIVVRHPTVPGYLEDLPYVVALVELDDQPGLRFSAQIAGVEPSDVSIGQRVRVELVELPGGDKTVPVFELSE